MKLETLLTTLRKHGVAEYTKDQFGTRVKFGAEPTLEAAQKVIVKELERITKPPPIPVVDVPELPEPYVAEPERLDLEEILPGGTS